MVLINLFDFYFLILVIYASLVLVFWDYRVLMDYGDANCARTARRTGIILMVISICLFVLRIVMHLFFR